MRRFSLFAAIVVCLLTAGAFASSNNQSISSQVLFQYATSSNYYDQGAAYAENGLIYGNLYNGFNNAEVFSSSGNTNMTPSKFNQSFLLGGGGGHQVGYAPDSTAHFHPYVWSGSASSGVDLLASSLGMTSGIAYGPDATNVVGTETGYDNALDGQAALWNTTSANSIVDLAPANLGTSQANAVSGNEQVGEGQAYGTSRTDAYLWKGTAASAVDLTPTFGIQTNGSDAYATNGTQQGGEAEILYTPGSSDEQAMLWSGTAASAINLNPAGVQSSVVYGMNATTQVGTGDDQAYAWFGTAASAINLQALLPSTDTWASSQAYSVDSNNIIYGTATDTNNNSYAVEWVVTTSVPEPASLCLAVAGCALLYRRQPAFRR